MEAKKDIKGGKITIYFTWTGKMTPTVDCNKLDVYIR